jgi:hypothetical protein
MHTSRNNQSPRNASFKDQCTSKRPDAWQQMRKKQTEKQRGPDEVRTWREGQQRQKKKRPFESRIY